MHDRPTKAATATLHLAGLQAHRLANGWLEFRFGDLLVQALIYDEPSRYGIDHGRISKLWAREAGGAKAPVLNYDRGWDQRPVLPEGQALLDEMQRLFPEAYVEA